MQCLDRRCTSSVLQIYLDGALSTLQKNLSDFSDSFYSTLGWGPGCPALQQLVDFRPRRTAETLCVSSSFWQRPLSMLQTIWQHPPSLRRQSHTLARPAFVFDDSYTLWCHPPLFSTTVTHFGNTRLHSGRQLHTLVPPLFSTTVTHFGNCNLRFFTTVAPWQLSPFEVIPISPCTF